MKVINKENVYTIKEFQKHHFMSTLKYILISMLAFIILGIFLVLHGNDATGTLSIFFGITYPFVYGIIFFVANRKLNKSNKAIEKEKIVETEFFDDKLSSKTYLDDELINQLVYKYNEIYKVDETNKSFYIYVAINMSICISKEEMSEIDILNLRNILKTNCKKYKNMKF